MPSSRILAFGYHDQTAPRHWTISRQMLSEGFELVECHTSKTGLFGKYRDLLRQYRQKRRDMRALLVTFPGHYLVPLAWMLTRFPRRWLIFDAFVSLHDTAVDDRKVIPRWHPQAWFLYMVDWMSCHMADTVLVDTEAHREFFIRKFHLKSSRVQVIYLGARTDLFKPKNRNSQLLNRNVIDVLFYGTYIPLQGIDVILGAAKMLQSTHPDVRFTLIGRGQTYSAMKAWAEREGLKNVRFESPIPYQNLPERIRSADVCLGIFGTSGKAGRVIPHKVYDAVACGTPVITADTSAIREKFANDPLVTLIPAGSPEMLANAIGRSAHHAVR